ncbi:MAG TPA: NAD(P)H-hydrate dehydratase [Ohtaekwangia sp.]|nr:NAD(P)H-hydrate dehydratase [Ohtaekwangia sp.]
MIRILTTDQIKALDAYTIGHEPVLSINLMERACKAFAGWFVEHFPVNKTVGIVCGTGNNGGDGLGIARLLHEWGFGVKVWVVRGAVPESPDYKTNLQRLQQSSVSVSELRNGIPGDAFTGRDLLIDAIFGSGLSRPAEGIYAEAIERINQADAIRIAVDIPSGLMADKPSSPPIVAAHYTVSFQLPKLALLLPGHHAYVGEWTLVDIGLSKTFIKGSHTRYFYLVEKDARKILRSRSTFDHKGDFGHALIVAGSYGKAGAAILASRASLRSGVGLLTVHAPSCAYTALQTAVPEAMVDADVHDAYLTNHPALNGYDCVGIGPGLGNNPATLTAFTSILQSFGKPMVIDADGINMLAERPEVQEHIPAGSILTPHPKEFQRLAGPWQSDFERLDKQQALASKLGSVVIVKGAYTTVAAPDGNVYFNSTGNPGMATGGTGDVLTGVITGLLAQGYSSLEAACLGVYIHGLAADLALPDTGMISMTASDVIDYLPAAFRKVSR